VLCNLKPYDVISEDNIANILENNPQVSKSQNSIKAQLKAEFVEKQSRSPSIDELRPIYNLAYSFDFFSEE